MRRAASHNAAPTDEARAKSKEIHRRVMLILGVLTTIAGLTAAYLALSWGRELPALFYGRWGKPTAQAATPRGRCLVDWQAWGSETRALAKEKDRLILLELACSWGAPCRLMEETTFADPEVARYVADRLVPARVDAEALGSLAPRYFGKPWPTTALLLPDGRAVATAGYMDSSRFLAWARDAETKRLGRPQGILYDQPKSR